jgi:cell division inhibitor SepF
MFDKLKNSLKQSDFEETTELEFVEEESSMNVEGEKMPAVVKRNVSAEMVLVQPTSYQEAKEIGNHIKAGKGIILNLQNLSNEDGVRVIDFISGIVHAVEGSVKKIAVNTFICLPKTIGVEGQITFDN